MEALGFLIVLLVLCAAVAVIGWPLRSPGRREGRAGGDVAELEAAKQSKYSEIRDAELDHRTGKLSAADWAAIDGSLRAEAVAILKRLDRARVRLAEEAENESQGR